MSYDRMALLDSTPEKQPYGEVVGGERTSKVEPIALKFLKPKPIHSASKINSRPGFAVTTTLISLSGVVISDRKKKWKKQGKDNGNGATLSAVVSCTRKMGENTSSIDNHFPSLPINSCEKASRITPTWDHVGNSCDDMGNFRSTSGSTFKFFQLTSQSRLILDGKKTKIGAKTSSKTDVVSPKGDNSSAFIPEHIDIKISLVRSGEMISLGSASLVVSEPTEEVKLNLPVKQSKSKRSFSSDKSRRVYEVEENATLCVHLRVRAVSSINAALSDDDTVEEERSSVLDDYNIEIHNDGFGDETGEGGHECIEVAHKDQAGFFNDKIEDFSRPNPIGISGNPQEWNPFDFDSVDSDSDNGVHAPKNTANSLLNSILAINGTSCCRTTRDNSQVTLLSPMASLSQSPSQSLLESESESESESSDSENSAKSERTHIENGLEPSKFDTKSMFNSSATFDDDDSTVSDGRVYFSEGDKSVTSEEETVISNDRSAVIFDDSDSSDCSEIFGKYK